MKKAEMAVAAEQVLVATDWLPSLLRTAKNPAPRMMARDRFGLKAAGRSLPGPGRQLHCHAPRKRGIQYAAAYQYTTTFSGIVDRPVEPGDH
jgi:hypothetical protein